MGAKVTCYICGHIGNASGRNVTINWYSNRDKNGKQRALCDGCRVTANNMSWEDFKATLPAEKVEKW